MTVPSHPTVDSLLAEIRIPVSSAPFDAARGLRRLAAGATGRRAAGRDDRDRERVRHARQTLTVLSHWVLSQPGAAAHLARLVDDPPPDPTDGQDAAKDDILDGALVFACLLYLTGRRESAQFWWQLAAGAGDRAAAYCLHLHHWDLDEPREANHWYGQARKTAPGSQPLVSDIIDVLESMARYSRKHGRLRLSTESLEADVDRLTGRDTCGIVTLPDRRLADRLHQVTGRR